MGVRQVPVRRQGLGVAASASACPVGHFRWRVLRHQHLTVPRRPAGPSDGHVSRSAIGRSRMGAGPMWRWLRVLPGGVGPRHDWCQRRRLSCH